MYAYIVHFSQTFLINEFYYEFHALVFLSSVYVSVFLMVCYCLGAGFYSPVHEFLNRILD